MRRRGVSALDESWKHEQLAFLQREQERRKAARPAALGCFSRAPSALFSAYSTAHPHETYVTLYRGVTLGVRMGAFASGHTFAAATVNATTGFVQLFCSPESVYRSEPVFADTVRAPLPQGSAAPDLLAEALAFLQRGHSWLAVDCMCPRRAVSADRRLHLGVGEREPAGVCMLPRSARISAELVAAELAVSDIYAVDARGYVCASRAESLGVALEAHPRVDAAQPPGGVSPTFRLRQGLDDVHSREELFAFIDQSPLGVSPEKTGGAYAHFEEDARALGGEGRVRAVEGSHGIVAFARGAGSRCDEDVCALWDACGADFTANMNLAGELRKHDLRPTAQLAACAAASSPARKARGKGRGRVSGGKKRPRWSMRRAVRGGS